MATRDYRALGLKVGLEVHQQLSTGKLFCSCPCALSENVEKRFVRLLRPSQSEMGEIDRAALEEAQKNMRFTYESTPFDCLVEADEEPPHPVSSDAVRTTLMISKMIGARPVDEIQFMRKIVIDGSNTGGFQRTGLIATGGSIEVDGKKVSISTVCLEEDAARRIREEGREIVFRIDRLGIPLTEIATGPEIETPEEAKRIAERIGTLLRATRRVRRGIGSVREDLNVSITGGARVEIKGVQELYLLPQYIDYEVLRQESLIEISKKLSERGVKELKPEMVDLSEELAKTKSKVLMKSLGEGGRILGIRLPGFKGLLGPDPNGTRQLGPEIAAHAKVAGVGGIFHSDELPAYGITDAEVDRIDKKLGLGDADCFVLVAGSDEETKAAIVRVIARAVQAIQGVPEETRDPMPDGTTAYSRPLPGRERMYPETDIPPFTVTTELMEEIGSQLPEYPEEIVRRLREEHGLSGEQADALVRSGFDRDFDELIDASVPPKTAARTLINTLAELEKDGLDTSLLSSDMIKAVLQRQASGDFAMEAVPMLLGRMVEKGESFEQAMNSLDIASVSDSEIEKVVESIVREKRELILERKERSIAPLMGLVMKELRGKADGKKINAILAEKIKAVLE